MKKFISVFLSALFVFSVVTVAFADEQSIPSVTDIAESTDYDGYPLIILPGINHSVSYLANDDGTLYKNSKGETVSGGLLLVDTDGIFGKLIKKLFVPLVSSLALGKDKGISSAAYDVVCDLLSIMSCDKQGNPTRNLITDFYEYPVSQMDKETKAWFYRMLPMQKIARKIGEKNVYLYTFPLVGDPMESAEGLKDFIELVKKQTGKDKVNLATVSLGGTVLTAYADIIGNDWSNVNKIINVVSCLNGTDVFGDFYDREWNLDDEFLFKDYLRNIFTNSNGNAVLGCLINGIVRLMPKKLVYSVLTGAYSGVLDTLFLNNPQFWATIPGSRYEKTASRYISDASYSVLKAKTDKFQNAKLNLNNNLVEAKRQGVTVNNICGSDLTFGDGEYCFLGIVKSNATCNADGIVPVYSASLGGTAVPTGTQFDESYIENAEKDGKAKYISTYKSIDASTCLFPDNVWFFQKQHHEIGYNDSAMELMSRIVTGDITDIYSSPEFPQYMFMRNTKRLTRWLVTDSDKVFAGEKGEYSEKQLAKLRVPYENAKLLLENYATGEEYQTKLDAADKELTKTLADIGARDMDKTDWFGSAVEKPLKKIDDVNYNIWKIFH